MDINIQSLSGISTITLIKLVIVIFSGDFIITISGGDTIGDLKKKIEEEEGLDQEGQSLYFKGFLIDEDSVSVSDLTKLGANTFSLTLPTLSGQNQEISADSQLHLVVGSRHDFETRLVPKNQTSTFKLVSQKFGIIYHKEGSEIGKRIFHANVFKIKEEGTIHVKTLVKDGGISSYKVTLQNSDGSEEELVGVLKSYDESKNKQEDNWNRAEIASRIVGRGIGAIGALVFGGKTIILYIFFL